MNLLLALFIKKFGIIRLQNDSFFPPDLYVGVADILQPDILVQEVTGEDRMRERVILLIQEKEEKGTMATVATAPSLTNQNTTFFKASELFFPAPELKAN